MPTPKITVLMPIYNGEKYLKEAINSVLTQTFKDFEFLIINDGSTDKSDKIIESYSDQRIKILNNDKNLGIQKTLNRGLNLARGEYIARIDADDEWIDINKLQKQVEFLNNNSKYVLIGAGVSIVDYLGKENYKIFLPRTDKEIRKKMLKANQFFHSSIVIRKSALEKTGFYNENVDIKHVEDYDLWLRLGQVGDFYNLPIIALRYRDINSSISRQNIIEQLKKNISLIKKYRDYYPGFYFALIRNYLKLLIYGYGRLFSLRKYIFRFTKHQKNNNQFPKMLIWESLSHIAGGQRVLLNIIPFLKSDFTISVIVLAQGDLSQALNKMGVTVKFINPGNYNAGKKSWKDFLKYIIFFPLNLIKSFQLIKNNDLIYVNSTRVLPVGILGGLIFRKPVIWHNHILVSDGKTKILLNILTKSPCLKKIIAVSQSVKNHFSQLVNKTEVVYNGIDLDKFKSAKKLSVSNSKKIVVIGDLMPTKGQDVLIRALSSLKNIDYQLKIIGSARIETKNYELNLKTLVKNLGIENKVKFLGQRNDVPQLLADADILVLPSTVPEACPMVILEAMACGVPIIVSDLGGTKEIVQDSYNGYLFNAGDECGLSKKLNKFFNLNPKIIQQMKLNCRREAKLKYDLKDNANKINQIIKKVLLL